MKKVILTGATGMIGLPFIDNCLSKKIEVTAIVRPNSPNIGRLPKHDMLKVIECDLYSMADINKQNNDLENNYDAFYHFGWDGIAAETRYDTDLQTQNIAITLEAVKLSHRLGCKAFIGAGSQAEYGRVEGVISIDTKINPDSAYGIAKYAAGKMAGILAANLGIRYNWVRIFSVYGLYDNSNTMISYVIKQLLKGEKALLTPCQQKWDYLFSEDAALAFYYVGLDGRNQKTYCLGSGYALELSQYVHTIATLMDMENTPLIKIGGRKYSDDQVMSLEVDISHLTKDVMFLPAVPFGTGIMKTIKWMREQMNEKD